MNRGSCVYHSRSYHYLGVDAHYTVLKRWQLGLAGVLNRTVRDAAELLPRYAVDNIFVSDKFKKSFPAFLPTTFRQGLVAIRDDTSGV